ncbi:MAG: competence type IV pilus major pilin ComGC [Phycisphaerales bacterium]
MRKRNTGFTLVEILIVVVILGILAAIVVPQFTSASQSAVKGAIQSQLQTISSQVELYRVKEQARTPTSPRPTTTAGAISSRATTSRKSRSTALPGRAASPKTPRSSLLAKRARTPPPVGAGPPVPARCTPSVMTR